tara:strand:- start:1774 stop:2337 length:564 start_codon:yes stop_codon:yes gene_type:complete
MICGYCDTIKKMDCQERENIYPQPVMDNGEWVCNDCYENDKYCDGGCGTTDIWERSEINMCKICETKKIDKEYEEECAEMRRKGYERDECGEWEFIGIDCDSDCGDEAECDLCEKKFVKHCDEWGATNMIGNKGEIHPLEFCYDCWEDEVENSVWNDELEIMVWNKDKYLEELNKEAKPISKLLGLE